jgi:hypothetical protein
MNDSDPKSLVADLERRLADAQARLPKHSTPMSLILELEELEDALARARAEADAYAPGDR